MAVLVDKEAPPLSLTGVEVAALHRQAYRNFNFELCREPDCSVSLSAWITRLRRSNEGRPSTSFAACQCSSLHTRACRCYLLSAIADRIACTVSTSHADKCGCLDATLHLSPHEWCISGNFRKMAPFTLWEVS